MIRPTAVPYQDIQIQIPWLPIYHPSAHAPEPEDRAVAYSRRNCHLEEPCLETPWDIYQLLGTKAGLLGSNNDVAMEMRILVRGRRAYDLQPWRLLFRCHITQAMCNTSFGER